MVKCVELWLPAPPSVNNMYRSGRGRVYRSTGYKRWQQEADLAFIQAGGLRPWSAYPVCVEIDLFPGPQYRQRDLDNIVKPLLDFLVYRSVLADDSTQHIRRVVVQFQSERLQSNQVRLRIRRASSL